MVIRTFLTNRAIRLASAGVLLWVAVAAPAHAAARPAPPAAVLPAADFSPALLGIYRKVMVIEPDIIKYSAKYGLDVALAKAVCMYESGGNANLTSSAGARGYFQVMPATQRLMRVRTNVEAGVKYLARLVKQFGREDYALAAYNGGPGRVARSRPMPLESLQYVIGVGAYRSVLKAHEASVRAYASHLELTTVRSGDDWWALAKRVQLPIVQLRLHNPFLAGRRLRTGDRVAYPAEARSDLFAGGDGSQYRIRLGDNYLNLAYALDVNVARFRDENSLWRLQAVLPGTELTIPDTTGAKFLMYTVRAEDTLAGVAERNHVDPWWIVRDNRLWDEQLETGAVIRIRQGAPPAPARTVVVHRVKRGDTLSSIGRRYGKTVRALQAANGMGRRTKLMPGQRLRIPMD
jgi:LysM repeat protein